MEMASRTITLTSLLLLPLPLLADSGAREIKPVAVSGQLICVDACDSTSPTLTSFDRFGLPDLNEHGEIAFNATPAGLQVGSSLLLADAAGTHPLVFVGDSTTGSPATEQFTHTYSPDLSDTGELAFAAKHGLTISDDISIWRRDSQGNLRQVAARNDAVPSSSGNARVNDILTGTVAINNAGTTVFQADIIGPGTPGFGVLLQDQSELSLIASGNSRPDGLPEGLALSWQSQLSLDNDGNVAFNASIANRTTGQSMGSALATHSDENGLQLHAVPGTIAPETQGSFVFERVFEIQMNSGGDITYRAGVKQNGGDPTLPFIWGVWLLPEGEESTLVALQGEPAPGLTEEAYFGIIDEPVINNRGDIAIVAGITNTDDLQPAGRGIWASRDDNGLTLVIREGEQAAGAAQGVTYARLFEDIAINNLGRLAFLGGLSGDGVHNGNDTAIWAEDSDGILELVVREGDSIDALPGPGIDLRTVESLHFLANGSYASPGISRFNNRGQLAFSATFTDGSSGVFLSGIQVPEPCSLLQAALVATLSSSMLRAGRHAHLR